MFDTVGRAIRRVASAALVAALAALPVTQATAQIPTIPMPTMPTGQSAVLTSEIVVAWTQSYPQIIALTQQVEAQYGAIEGNVAAATAALTQLNAGVAAYGFASYAEWASVSIAVATAYSVLAAPAEQRAMLMAVLQVPQANLDAVSPNLAAVAAVIDAE